jgi:hypothetical protein
MAERLMAKLDRLGAEAGIKQMTSEIYKFSQLLNDDKLKQWDEWRSQRTWVGLTDEDSSLLLNQSDLLDMFENIGWYSAPKNGFKKNGATLIRAIEAKLKEKNT